MMGLRSARIGRLAGIPIGIQPLWLVIVALITVSLGAVYYPEEAPGIAPAAAYALGLLSALLLFASILLHELGHAVVARRQGVEIEEIDLWLLGGVARMSGYPERATDELRFALAGPAVTFIIALLFGAILLALPAATPDWLQAVVAYQAIVNAIILVFNLIPAFPLDGGRVTRALLWWRRGDISSATDTAATIGRGIGYWMIAVGALTFLAGAFGGLWLALIGFFVVAAAKAEAEGLRIRVALSGRSAGRLMSFPAITLPAEMTVSEALADHFVAERLTAFPVLRDGRLVGLLDLETVKQVPAERRDTTAVGAVAFYDESLVVPEDQDVAELLERPAFARVGRAVVRTADGRLGLLSITDVERVLRALDLTPAAA
ncbi:MAG TPA: site-2 protease family protein [Solirubrobacterales bacterium]|nr:site-2 protease family protein [Solirubrobacterales bacterium]